MPQAGLFEVEWLSHHLVSWKVLGHLSVQLPLQCCQGAHPTFCMSCLCPYTVQEGCLIMLKVPKVTECSQRTEDFPPMACISANMQTCAVMHALT